ncbi:MAG: hypothetical protein QOI38_2467 [Sphingomonadales bacterium]|jgi:hypothetical protein|nr:hypothetical protein [Sphingomonadales bacterium]
MPEGDQLRLQPNVLSEDQTRLVQTVKQRGQELINLLPKTDDPEADRALSIAEVRLEEAIMWAVKGITSRGL